MNNMMRTLIIFSFCYTLSVNAAPWPSCNEVTNTQTIFHTKSGNYNLLDNPCELGSPTKCQKSCCQSEMEGKTLRGVMAAPYEALEYYMKRDSKPIGIHPAPFYFYNGATEAFDLTHWDPKNIDKFKFQVSYLSGYAILKYAGNVASGVGLEFISSFLIRPKKDIQLLLATYKIEELFATRMIASAAAPGCSCGFYQAIEIKSKTKCLSGFVREDWMTLFDHYACFGDYSGEFLCQDIDECYEGVDNCNMVPHSHCVNTIGSFRCECDSGYLPSGSQCLDIGIPISTRIEPTSMSARIYVSSKDLPKPNWSYTYNVTDTTNPAYPVPVYRATQVKVSQAMAKSGIQISNLSPGRNYTVAWNVFDENGTDITAFYGYTSEETLFSTLCTCGLQTDAPILLGNDTITQEHGHIYFKFLGNSMCGDAYTFARQSYDSDGSLSKHTVFTPNYFFTGGECSPVPYEPGKSAADVLANSRLTVGAKYRYTFRAVGNKYLGDSSSMDFQIRWESSITGFVGLQPEFGDLPVEDVFVRWALKDENGTIVLDGNTTTTKSGRFTIHPNALLPFDNDRDYPMHLSFSKVTEIDGTHKINHEFLCHNGRVNCTGADLVIHLKHLDFDVPVRVADSTSVPVSGKVYVANTSVNPDGARWGGDGCPVQKAKVCLIDRAPAGLNNELVCTETASDGTYKIAGVIGSRVSINVTYQNHTFEYLPSKDFTDFSKGIEIQPERIYEQNDFMDTTTVSLELTIAGGVCNFGLGAAEVTYSINGCLWGGQILHQPELRNFYSSIPAQDLRFSVNHVENRPDIQFASQSVDLRELPSTEMTQSPTNDDSEEVEKFAKVRFEYNGVSKIRVRFSGDMNDGCTKMTPDTSSVETDSIHVLPFQRPTVAMIFIERDLGAGLVCDGVDPSSQLMIQNNLGLQANDSGDDTYAVAVASSMPPEALELLYHCNQGCVVNITQDYDSNLNRYTRARVEFQFMTGRPNIAEPFIKRLIVQTVEPNSVRYVAGVVVTGQYKRGDLYSVGLPTYEPVLIIRDPPGGTSYAFYENVQTTLRVESRKFTEYIGAYSNEKLLAGAKVSFGACTGFGISACKQVIDTKNRAGHHSSNNMQNLTKLNHTINSGGFTTSWSYKTSSSNPLFTGNLSDTYVVPNLNMKFSLIDTVSWNQSTCTASIEEETAFNLESPENVPALAFVTGFEIVNTEIPSLELNIESTKRAIDRSMSQAEKIQLENELKALEDALKGWRDALSLNEELKQKAISGNDRYQVKPHQWFDKAASKAFGNHTDSIDTSGMSHNSAMLSEDLMSHSKIRPSYRSAGSARTDLESINTIKISGGGNEFVFRLSQSKMNQHVSDLGGSYKMSNTNGAEVVTDNTITMISVALDYAWGDSQDDSAENLRTDEKSSSTAVGFALSDPDAGDQFDVDVFIDPVFGTFVFHTRSGKTLCKHEPGTENRQLVKMELVSVPPTVVLEDEVMTFHYQITKLGMGSLGYMLSQDVRGDSDALHYYPRLPREYTIVEYGKSILGTMTIARGPEKYEYPAITLILQPSCEYGALPLLGDEATLSKVELYNYIDPVDQSKKIVFARPCAPVVLQGDIARDGTFVIRSDNPQAAVSVVVQNPESSTITWADAIQDSKTRLKRVQLQYRPVGSTKWLPGQRRVNDTLMDIDFALAGVEDAYGFATVGWEVSHLMDGNYEMQVRTVCDNVHDAPAIFNGQETEVIRGVIDRKAPKLYGLPQPQVELPIGQPITMTFDEPLDCSLPLKFIVDLQVEGIERSFDHENLLVICEDRQISVQFDGSSINMNDLVGKHLSMKVSGVLDANRNVMTNSVSYSVDIVAAGSGQALFRRQLREVARDPTSSNSVGELQDALQVLKHDMEELRASFKNDMDELRQKMPETIAKSHQEIHGEIVNLTTDILTAVRSLRST